jgi:hypothetical protein
MGSLSNIDTATPSESQQSQSCVECGFPRRCASQVRNCRGGCRRYMQHASFAFFGCQMILVRLFWANLGHAPGCPVLGQKRRAAHAGAVHGWVCLWLFHQIMHTRKQKLVPEGSFRDELSGTRSAVLPCVVQPDLSSISLVIPGGCPGCSTVYRCTSGKNSDVLERTLVARRVPSGAV